MTSFGQHKWARTHNYSYSIVQFYWELFWLNLLWKCSGFSYQLGYYVIWMLSFNWYNVSACVFFMFLCLFTYNMRMHGYVWYWDFCLISIRIRIPYYFFVLFFLLSRSISLLVCNILLKSFTICTFVCVTSLPERVANISACMTMLIIAHSTILMNVYYTICLCIISIVLYNAWFLHYS